MVRKILKGILKIILVLLIVVIGILSYYLLVDRKTQQPKDMETACYIETKYYQNRKVFFVTPKEGIKNNLRILYFHGGSYMAEATKQHWDFIEKIVLDTGCTIILPDYPLAPKYNYKNVFEMVEPFYKEVIQQVETKNLIVMGDSAGGGLALALEEKLSQEEISMPKKTILISPWLDVRLTNPAINEVQKVDKQLNKETLKLAGIAYSGEDGINSYLVNPIDGDLSKLKNIMILTGTYDILNPDVHVLKERAKKVDTPMDIKEYEKAGHIWIIEKNSTQELEQQAYGDILEFINKE